IRGLAFAHSTDSRLQNATANAKGINYDNPTSPNILLENSGHVQATASAYAHDTLDNQPTNFAEAAAGATAVRMFLTGRTTDLAPVHNRGGITANAHAFATGYDTGNPSRDVFALAEAFGFDQHLFAGRNATAVVTNYASGNIVANALAHTLALNTFGDATSYAVASNHQFIQNTDGPGFNGSASVKNFGGFIGANANATAISTEDDARAHASANAVDQTIIAGPEGRSGTASVLNTGRISAYATAKAFAEDFGTARALAV